jgi:hypothetical protein
MSAVLKSTPIIKRRVPFEHLGQARMFRWTVERGDAAAIETAASILAPLKKRHDHHPIPRPELLVEAARRWEAELAGPARLALSIERSHRRLRVDEMRVQSIGGFRVKKWKLDAVENAMLLSRWSLSVWPRLLSFDTKMLALVGLHSLARRFERGRDRSTEAIMRDLRHLGEAGETQRRAGEHVIVPVPDGQWAGVVMLVNIKGMSDEAQPLLVARTFIDSDSIPDTAPPPRRDKVA